MNNSKILERRISAPQDGGSRPQSVELHPRILRLFASIMDRLRPNCVANGEHLREF